MTKQVSVCTILVAVVCSMMKPVLVYNIDSSSMQHDEANISMYSSSMQREEASISMYKIDSSSMQHDKACICMYKIDISSM